MTVTLAHKIRLNPTVEQAQFFRRCAGVSRFVFNHGLAEWQRLYGEGINPSARGLKKEFNAIKREEFPFVTEVPKDVSEGAFSNLGRAFKNFFDGLKGKRPRMGFPRFKSKRRSKATFTLNNDKFRVDGHWLKVPRMKELVNMAEVLRFAPSGHPKIMNGVVSEDGGKWYISITVQMPKPEPINHPVESVGIDLGLKTLATLSDEKEFENQKFLRSELNQLKRLNRELSRRIPGSNRWWKTKHKLQRFHAKIRNRRMDAIHKMTTQITSTYAFVGVEDLHVAGMVRNRKLALSISDASMGEVLRQLEYKAEWLGGRIQKVGRFFASSKLCNDCGHKNKELPLSDRRWVCAGCGVIHDRDWNAAKNIEQEALRLARA